MPVWQLSRTKTHASLRGIHAVSAKVAWAGGAGGIVLRLNAGSWESCAIASGAEKLDFRAVWAWNNKHALAMSSGPGDLSRLYVTGDGCASWRLAAVNKDKGGFWDALVFAGDQRTGYILGDPVDGRFTILSTHDGGNRWVRDQSAALAADPQGEGAFAASNSSLAIPKRGDLIFGTGGKGGARIFYLHRDEWRSSRVPVGETDETSGIYSIAFRDAMHGVAVGGDYKKPQSGLNTAIWTADGGVTWHQPTSFCAGYRSSAAWSNAQQLWVAVGPSGSDVSRDNGRSWEPMDAQNWNALSLPWVSGPEGHIAKLGLRP